VIFVGDHPHGARQFLHDERLPVEFVQVGRDEYRQLFQDHALPIVIADNRKRRDILAKQSWIIGAIEPESDLESVIVRMANTAAF
jgi:hypothetical protein